MTAKNGDIFPGDGVESCGGLKLGDNGKNKLDPRPSLICRNKTTSHPAVLFRLLAPIPEL